MITLDEFDKVQILLGREGRPRPKQHFFTYTGIMKCAECGSSITACEKEKLIKSTGEVKKYIFYYCTRRKKGTTECTQRKVVPLSELEAQINEELSKVSVSDHFRELALEVIREDYATTAEEEQKIYESKLKELSTLEREVKNLFQMRLNESIDDELYKNERNDREKKITILKAKIKEEENGARKTISETEDRFVHVNRLQEKFKRGTSDEKKSIFMSLGWNFTLKDKKVHIFKHEWILSIEKRRGSIQTTLDSLEPTERLDE